MKSVDLSIVIVTGNEEEMIVDCLKSAEFADEIIIVATPPCTSKTLKLAQETVKNLKIIKYTKPGTDFSAWHNFGAAAANGRWQFHLDCDERITPELQLEIKKIVEEPNPFYTNYDIPRANYFLGKRVRHGGTYPDYVKRLFLGSSLSQYVNALHEQPQINGPASVVKNNLLHFTHRNLTSMLEKSIQWTPGEAKLLFDAGHPPVVWWRFIRMMLTKLWERLIQQQMWRDGTVGFISAIFESFDTFMIYAQLYELQQQKT